MPRRPIRLPIVLGVALVLTGLSPFPSAARADGAAEAKSYRPDFDYPGRGDDWYGRFLPDPRRDFPSATDAVDRASDGDDFGRGYAPLVARAGFGPPLGRTNLAGSAYAFHNDPIASGIPTADCDANGIDDACDLDCGAPGGPCDVPGCGLAADCDGNAVPDACQLAGDDCDGDGRLDACQLADAAAGCSFGVALAGNGTTGADDTYLGPPDDVYFGLGGQAVTWELTCGAVYDGPGPDITLYEVDTGSPEFHQVDLLVSADGVAFVSLKATESVPVRIPGDETHGNDSFARSYDLAGSGLPVVRFVRADGVGTGGSGTGTQFDVDAIGFVHTISADCDATGTLDACESAQDCNGNAIPESCEVAFGVVGDCDASGTPDTCDTLGGANDCDGDAVPDVCELDCNANGTPDDCDILGATSADCNGNAVPDECDLALTTATIEAGFAASDPATVFVEDFETPDTANFSTYSTGGSIVTASATWDVIATGVDLYEAAVRPEASSHDGAQALDLTGSPGAGAIETSIAVASGQAYELSFHYARNNLLGAEPGDATVEVLGAMPLLQASVVHDPAERPFDDWLEFRGFFVADSSSVTLRFTSHEPGNAGITLDGIAVSALPPTGTGIPIGSGFPGGFERFAPFPAASAVSAVVTASSDLGASNEYLDLTLNALPLARFFETDGAQCVEVSASAAIDPSTFNAAAGAGGGAFALVAPGTVNAFECAESRGAVRLSYEPIVDCNANGTLDQCDIAAMTSMDLNANAIADECEPDCNANGTPDDYDIAQGISDDCNANGLPDECDTAAGGASDDCNADAIPDECQSDCNANGVPDDCDIAGATSPDCDGNAIPDECDLAVGAGGCPFPRLLLDNGTTGPDENYLGAPDGAYWGLGGQIVTYEFDCGFVVDGPGPDFNLYEVGGAEYHLLDDILVSGDGVTFVSVIATEGPGVRIPGDEVTSSGLIRSYDLAGTGVTAARFVRIDGAGTGASGNGTGFDLDAIGAIQRASNDCDGGGLLDVCEAFEDCNANGLQDSCELDLGLTDDCDANGDLDVCDIAGGAPDVDFDWIPDGCEPDCDGNAVPDHYDIEQGTSTDCNDNGVPDSCDLDQGGIPDCNADGLPDDCPVCPTVEVVFIMDTSSSMGDEGSALCAELNAVVAELQADLVDLDVELLGILSTGGSTFSCLTDTVGNLYGTAVPGGPPAGQEILGEPCGANLNEDWGPATAIVAGLKPWQPGSVRLIVPLSDEGPRCGDPVSDPGEDRLAINHAIGQARLNDVIVSPVAGTGSGAALVAIMDVIADATGGGTFESADPDLDLADGLSGILEAACFSRTDCNANGVPDDCDLAASTSQDCDGSGRPDECENDCNANGLEDSCDIADMTSVDDNANAVPDECEGLVLTSAAAEWTWTPVPTAIGYDLIRGDLGLLRSTGGDFIQATDVCLADDTTATTWPHALPDPAPGEGQWVLVRGVIGGVDLTYDALGTGQVEGRDVEIEASGVACP